MSTSNNLSGFYRQAKRVPDSASGSGAQKSKDFRSIFVSDVHLGTKDCKAGHLNAFLKHYSSDNLFLVGDIFDGWKMKSGVFWNTSFNRIIRRVLKLSKKGVKIYYITGNHDEFLRKYANNAFENILLCNRIDHVTADNRKLLVIHGDQFEGVTHCSRWLRLIGDTGYELLMFLNRVFNRLRARYGYGYWSFSGFLKSHIQRAQAYIEDYEKAVAYGAQKEGYDGVVCGHIHHAAVKEIGEVTYYNTGDWVESCTAIVEDHDGTMHLKSWLDDPNHKRQATALKKRLEQSKERIRTRKRWKSDLTVDP